MRKTLAIALTAAALTFGGAGVATAAAPAAGQSVVAQGTTNTPQESSDKTGLWGLLGLLGLAGLGGLKRRNNTADVNRSGTTNPR